MIMGLGFMGGAYNRARGTRDAFGALSDELQREGHPGMVSKSGDREYADQLKIWNERMVLAADVRGRKVYATKTWQGKTWYQIHPDAVAVPTDPPTSNHGRRRANDLAWPYNDSSTAAHKRAQVLGKKYNITCEGLGFSRREPWHWTFWGALGTIDDPALAGGTGEDMPLDENDKKWLNGMGASIVAQLAKALAGVPADVWEHRVWAQDANGRGVRNSAGSPVTYPASGYLASTNAQVGGQVADVDEKALAAELAPLLTANLGALSDADVSRIASAAADEQARRMAG